MAGVEQATSRGNEVGWSRRVTSHHLGREIDRRAHEGAAGTRVPRRKPHVHQAGVTVVKHVDLEG